jgi:hypothetical protein
MSAGTTASPVQREPELPGQTVVVIGGRNSSVRSFERRFDSLRYSEPAAVFESRSNGHNTLKRSFYEEMKL